MKKVAIAILCFLLVISYGVYWAFFDMNRLPTGEYLTEQTSPDGTYTLKAYRTNGGATTAYAIRGELIDNSSKRAKNIYWNYREEEAEIEWIDEDTVVINGRTLDVPEERYDFRND